MAAKPNGNIRRDSAFGLVLLTVATLLMHLAGVGGWVQGFAAMAVFTFVPGAALLSLLPSLNLPARIGLAAAFSMAITAIYAYVLLLLHAYYPQIAIWSLYPIACAVLLVRAVPSRNGAWRQRTLLRARRARRRLADDRAAAFWLAACALAIVLWFIGVLNTDVTGLGGLGLMPALPITWKAGWLIALVAAGVYATSARPAWWVIAILTATPIAMFYLTPVIVYEVPHLPWNYKHIGVTELLLQLHHTRPNVDIYNRWPSFFGVAGIYTRLGDFDNPVQFVKWAELYFVAIQSVLVAALALVHDRRPGIAALASLFFFAITWIGQAYFAPQAMGFTLMLAVLLIFWQFLYAGGNRLGRLLATVGGAIIRRRQNWPDGPPGDWPRALAAAVMLLPMAGIVLVHQLTPYVLLLQLGALWMFGFIRPRWAFWAAAAITIAYLLPQLGWVNKNFGLFSSLNPLDNAKNVQTATLACNQDCQFVKGTARMMTLATWMLALLSILIIGRRRPQTRLAALAICFLAPFATLMGQNYGGEAALRVVLFGAPFSALLIVLAISTLKPRLLMRGAALLAVLGLSAGIFVSYLGLEGALYLTRDDVLMAEYSATHAPPTSSFIASGLQNASHMTANYDEFYDAETLGSILGPKYVDKPYSPAVLDDLIAYLSDFRGRVFIGFSPRNDRFNELIGQFEPDFTVKLHDAMLQSPYFRVWKRIGDTEAIEFIPKDRQ